MRTQMSLVILALALCAGLSGAANADEIIRRPAPEPHNPEPHYFPDHRYPADWHERVDHVYDHHDVTVVHEQENSGHNNYPGGWSHGLVWILGIVAVVGIFALLIGMFRRI